MKTVLHLTASRFLGGPERQMLGLAQHLDSWQTVFVSFAENGHCHPFLRAASQHGFEACALTRDTPHLLAAASELRSILRTRSVDALLCHGYKANLVGRIAARRLGIPVVAISRGWTSESFKVRRYESLDRHVLRWMDRVVCVSHAQAEKVRRIGIRPDRIMVIHNAINTQRFARRDSLCRAELEGMFDSTPQVIVGAAGRLSPEKGFQVLIRAAAHATSNCPHLGFVLFGDGPLRTELDCQLSAANLQGRFKLAGFRTNLDDLIPHFDLFALPSFTEGLPNVVLEAFAANVPVVATTAGGTPEVVDDGRNGFLVPPGDDASLAERILALAGNGELRRTMAARGHDRVERDFSFVGQAQSYDRLLTHLIKLTPEHLSHNLAKDEAASNPHAHA
jgi:glycosyltransferase involved in cell wall biosynthesis